MKNNFSLKNKHGFTLIEIMVSLGIFAIVALVAVGAFLKIIDANKQSQALQTAMNNTNFALESMVREMRVGKNYTCFDGSSIAPSLGAQLSGTVSCPSLLPDHIGYLYNGIAFTSSQTSTVNGSCNLIHAYRFSNVNTTPGPATLEKAEQKNCTDTTWTTNFIPLVSTDLNIQTFGVKIDGGGTQQPRAFILISAYAGPSLHQRTYFTIQTTASQRSQ